MPPIDDLTPFFSDPCWTFVILSRQSDAAVILRRGPTEWWQLTLWDTRHDRFQTGQWFRGRMYPDRCDLSPDGQLFLYFAGKHRPRDVARGYSYTWTAVSRPPYFTALALWPIGDTWGGGGVFLDNRTVLVATSCQGSGAKHHPRHPPGPLRVLEYSALPRQDPRRDAQPCWQTGWKKVGAEFHRASGELTLGQQMPIGHVRSNRGRVLYTLYRANGQPAALFEAHWADWDRQGRLLASVGGRILAGKLSTRDRLLWLQLASVHEQKPERREAPEWAQHW